jgi:hypothetical protein
VSQNHEKNRKKVVFLNSKKFKNKFEISSKKSSKKVRKKVQKKVQKKFKKLLLKISNWGGGWRMPSNKWL